MSNNKVHTLAEEIRLNSIPRGDYPLSPFEIRNRELNDALYAHKITRAEYDVLMREAHKLPTVATIEECTCQADMPDGRTGYICEVCRKRQSNQTIEF